jgi:L-lysine 2,3-aminomutase
MTIIKAWEKKLRLFKQDSGEILSKDLANSLQLLVDNGVVIDGESVIMEYVNDDCQFLIKSV